MNNKTDAPVTVIGLGLMGQALVRAFLKAGHPTTVWNRTTAKSDQLVAEGARLAPTVGDALKAGSLTIICLTDYQAMRELLGATGIELGGTTLINLTSGDSAQARDAAHWAEERGARYLDGAIMAVPPAIGTAEAVILHSGPRRGAVSGADRGVRQTPRRLTAPGAIAQRDRGQGTRRRRRFRAKAKLWARRSTESGNRGRLALKSRP